VTDARCCINVILCFLFQISDEAFILAIACNKTDLESERVVSKSRAEVFAEKNNALLFETSAKDNTGVEELFKKVSEEVTLKCFISGNNVPYLC
jgi:Ras-related protein Rab-5C